MSQDFRIAERSANVVTRNECRALLEEWDKVTKKIRHKVELKETGPISNQKLANYLAEELEEHSDVDTEHVKNILTKAIIDLRRAERI